jgi:hypothetical protein
VFAQSERLDGRAATDAPVEGTSIVLAGLVSGVQAGQALALTGKAPGALPSDPALSEVAFVQSTADDALRTTISLSAPLQNAYDPASLLINANVAQTTHGETVLDEVLGSGAGSQANQRFSLKAAATYVAPTTSAQTTWCVGDA